jgi:acid phosphatase
LPARNRRDTLSNGGFVSWWSEERFLRRLSFWSTAFSNSKETAGLYFTSNYSLLLISKLSTLRLLRYFFACMICLSMMTLASCGGGTSTSSGGGGSGGGGGNPPPSIGHVFLLVEENHGYSDIIGTSSMPYLSGLASQYGLATQYYANTHPSIGNYFMLTAGKIETNDDSFSGTISDDNIVRELVKAGKTWKSYAESLPSIGYTGGDQYPYARRHNPFSYLSDVIGTGETNNLVPFSQFPSDLAASTLPQFSFIVPNLLNDAHDGTLAGADFWLKNNIDPLISSSLFQKDGLLIIVFDEAETSDTQNGGGHVVAVVISPLGKKAYQSTTLYQHQSTLRELLTALGISTFPGAAASAPDMGEFF